MASRPTFALADIAKSRGQSSAALRAIVRKRSMKAGTPDIATVDGHTFTREKRAWSGTVPRKLVRNGQLRPCLKIKAAKDRVGVDERYLRDDLAENKKRVRGLISSCTDHGEGFKFSDNWYVFEDSLDGRGDA